MTSLSCYRCGMIVCRCGAQGYIAIPLPSKFQPTSNEWTSIDDHEHDRLKNMLNLVMNKWFDGFDEFDLMDAIKAAEDTQTRS